MTGKSIREFARIVGVTEGYIRLKLLSRGRNPAAYYHDNLIQLEYSELEIAEWFAFFETRIPAKFRKKHDEKPKKRVRLIPIKEKLNLDLTEEQSEQIQRVSALKRERIGFILSVLKKAQEKGVLDAGASNKQLQRLLKSHNISGNHRLSIVRYKKIVKKIRDNGIQKFIDDFEKVGTGRVGKTKVKRDDLEYFISQFASDNYLSAENCYKNTLGKAALDGRFDPKTDTFPSAASFMYHANKLVGKEALDRIRKGKDFHERNHADYIHKTTQDLFPMQCLVGDCMDFDVHVKIPAVKVHKFGSNVARLAQKQRLWDKARPRLTMWMDYRTLRPVGWVMHVEPQNTDHVLMALKKAVKNGMPQFLITDNGKTYANKELGESGKQRRKRHKSGVEIGEADKAKVAGIFAAAGILVKFALPFNAKAKIIERMFSLIHQMFEKYFEGLYVGTTKLRRPESTDVSLKDENCENLPTLEELTEKFNDFLENVFDKMTFETGQHAGRSPLSAWNDEYDASKLEFFSESAASILLARETRVYTVSRHQISHKKYDCYYYSPRLENGQKVYLRIDPDNKKTAWCYDEKDAFVCIAEQIPVVSALSQTPQERELLRKEIERTARSKKQLSQKIAIVKNAKKANPETVDDKQKYLSKYYEVVAQKLGHNHEEKTLETTYSETKFTDDLQKAAIQESEGTKLPLIAVGQDFERDYFEEKPKVKLRIF